MEVHMSHLDKGIVVKVSVKKMVIAMGMLTATMFLASPLVAKPGSCCNKDRTVRMRLSLVLNISFLITSKGFVIAAPATPASEDLTAERSRSPCAVVPENRGSFSSR